MQNNRIFKHAMKNAIIIMIEILRLIAIFFKNESFHSPKKSTTGLI